MGSRLWRVAGVVIAGAIAATCVKPDTERCADGSRCAIGNTCVNIEGSDSRCAQSGQYLACGENESGPCTFMGLQGSCLGGACFVAICGDGITEGQEICDDQNFVDGDGCAANCRSNEECGNNTIDLSTGEQCDEGTRDLSGDGCTNLCLREYRLWRDVTPGFPPLRSGHGVVTDPLYGVLLFGGTTGIQGGAADGSAVGMGAFADTWRWDGSRWTELTTPNGPTRRVHFAMAYDPSRGRVVLFGGFGPNGEFLNDTWEWDGVSWRQKMVANGPSVRAGASLACNMTGCYLFGGAKSNSGSGSANLHNDTWRWDGAAWTMLNLAGPTHRWRAPMVFDENRNAFILFGGSTGSATLNAETWELGTAWTDLAATGASVGMTYPSLAYDARPGVAAPTLVTTNDTYRLGGAGSGAWTRLTSNPGQMPTARIAFDKAAQHIAAVGVTANDDWAMADLAGSWSSRNLVFPNSAGATPSLAYDKVRGINMILSSRGTWEWDGRGLARISTTLPTMMQPQGAAIVFDEACGVTYAVGGATGTTFADATWRYDVSSSTWNPLPVTTPLTARTRLSVVYDDKRHVVVAFGGTAAIGGLSNEVYELGGPCDNKTWELRAPAGARPAPRDRAAMAFDSERDVTILFGGASDPMSMALGDTWEWDGTTWTQRTQAGAPLPRYLHAMAFDPRRRRVVMFGGRDDQPMNDTWEWNGVAHAWEQTAPAIRPSLRSGIVMAQDVTGDLIAIGGTGVANTALAEIMRFSSELSTDPREQCVLATDDADGDDMKGCGDPDCWTRCTPTCPPGQSCAPNEPRCGDTVCSAVEDYLICPADCSPT